MKNFLEKKVKLIIIDKTVLEYKNVQPRHKERCLLLNEMSIRWF